MGIKTVPQPPYSPDLAFCEFCLFSEAVVMRQLVRWKRLWRRWLIRLHKRTSMRPSRNCWNHTASALQPKEITWITLVAIIGLSFRKLILFFEWPLYIYIYIHAISLSQVRKKFSHSLYDSPIYNRSRFSQRITLIYWMTLVYMTRTLRIYHKTLCSSTIQNPSDKRKDN